MIKRIFALIFSLAFVLSVVPSAIYAENISEHSFTVPIAGASGASDKPLITVGTIADGHVDYGLQNNDPYIRSSYIKAMNALKAEGVDIILDGGDMTSDNEDQQKVDFRWTTEVYDRVIAQYKKYSSAASTTGITLWACGNHDYEVGQLKEGTTSAGDYNSYGGFMKTMIETAGQPESLYTEKMDRPNAVNSVTEDNWLGAHFNVKGFDFIILNPPYREWDYYTAGTLNWLDETLAGIGAGKTVFIVGHYPLQDSRGPSSTSLIKGTNYDNFMYVMKKYPNAIYLFGHIHDSDSGYIQSDTFERITHYDKNGKVVTLRGIQPTSFISSFVGSASFYNYSLNPDWLTAAEPNIIQAMTIKVYADRIEFKTINCGVKEGASRELMTYTVQRDVLNGGASGDGDVSVQDIWTLPSDILSAPNAKADLFGLYYMNRETGELSNNWNGTCAATYINISGGHGRGTFASADAGGIKVFPEYNSTAVVQFTAPKDGEYLYEVPVTSTAKTANGAANKHVVFSVMKDGVIYDITEPKYNENYAGTLSGTIKLNKGDKLLFTADWYVKSFASELEGGDHAGYWSAGSFNCITVALIDDTAKADTTKTYAFDGKGFNFTPGSYSIKSNTHYSIAAIDLSGKKLLNTQQGTTAIYGGNANATLYKGTAGDVTIAYHYSNGNLMFGPYGAGNADKKIASAIAFTAPESGLYNMTALLLHDWDYNASTKKIYSMDYEILDSKLNVVFSGSTANIYTKGNVQGTYSRAAGSVYLKKGETMYLSFKAAKSATGTDSDTMSMRIVSLATTLLSSECDHSWTNSVCSVCGKTCTHSFGNDNVCDTCGYKKPVTTTTPGATTTPGSTTTPGGTTDPDNTTAGGDETTVPDGTTYPDNTTALDGTTDNGNTTKPSETDPVDTTVPDDGSKNKSGNNDVVIAIVIVVAAVAVAAGIIVLWFVKKKKA